MTPVEYALNRLLAATADGAMVSLADHLGTDVITAMALRDAGRLGEAIEVRNGERAAERRSHRPCGCGCGQDRDPAMLDAFMRRRLIRG